MQRALESSAVPLKGAVVEPAAQWHAQRTVAIPDALQRSENATIDLTYTYQGVRRRNDRDEAVITTR